MGGIASVKKPATGNERFQTQNPRPRGGGFAFFAMRSNADRQTWKGNYSSSFLLSAMTCSVTLGGHSS